MLNIANSKHAHKLLQSIKVVFVYASFSSSEYLCYIVALQYYYYLFICFTVKLCSAPRKLSYRLLRSSRIFANIVLNNITKCFVRQSDGVLMYFRQFILCFALFAEIFVVGVQPHTEIGATSSKNNEKKISVFLYSNEVSILLYSTKCKFARWPSARYSCSVHLRVSVACKCEENG